MRSTAARHSIETITPAANTRPLARTAAGCFFRLFHDVEGLDRQHRKHAGHEIQDQAAQDGEQQQRSAENARGIVLRLGQRCEARTGLELAAPAPEKSAAISMGTAVGLRAVLLGHDQHAADRAGFGRLIADLHRKLDGILGARQCLRRRVLDAALIVGKELPAT